MGFLEVAKNKLARAGFKLTRYPAPYSLPWQIRRVVEHHHIDAIVDVGAHHGEFARLLRTEVGFHGPVASFEPMPASFEALRRTMAGDSAWTGHCMALGATSGELGLNVYPETVFNSFLTPNALGQDMFAPELAAGSTTESVPVRRLDQVLDLPGALVLKVDTQGYDMEVIEGAAGVLERVAAILIELPVRPIYEGAPDLIEIMRWLAEWGYEPVGLFPVTRDPDYFRVVEFDGVFVRTDAPIRHPAWKRTGAASSSPSSTLHATRRRSMASEDRVDVGEQRRVGSAARGGGQ